MLKCMLSASSKRQIFDCRFNSHLSEVHPDRTVRYHDLIYIIDGDWEIWQDDIAYTMHAGDVLFLAAGHHHYGTMVCTKEVRTIFTHFESHPDAVCKDGLTPKDSTYFFPVHLGVPSDNQIPFLFRSMVSCYWQQNIYAADQAAAYLSLILCELSLFTPNKTSIISNEELVQRLIRMFISTPHRFYSIDELCALICVSRKTLHNYFKEVTGLSPHAYQIRSKLLSARQAIEKNPHINIGELVTQYGFCDEYHFSKMFKKEFGIPPRKYGKEISIEQFDSPDSQTHEP